MLEVELAGCRADGLDVRERSESKTAPSFGILHPGEWWR